MKTLEDEQYVVKKAHKFTVFEIWRAFNGLSYIACPTLESTDSMIVSLIFSQLHVVLELLMSLARAISKGGQTNDFCT